MPDLFHVNRPAVNSSAEKTPDVRIHQPSASVEQRLTGIEESLENLTTAVQHLTRLIGSNVSPREGNHSLTRSLNHEFSHDDSENDYETPPFNSTESPAYHDSSQIVSALPHVSSGLKTIDPQFPGVSGSVDGPASLRELSDAFAAVHFDTDQIRYDVRNAGRSGNLFYIPSRDEGQELTSKFLNVLEQARPLFIEPSHDLLPKIVYEPATVVERGWVLLFNCIVYTATAVRDPPSTALKSRLRWNTWLALEDAGLFLEPCEANIQALMALATHGEDFATPNLSWILIGHACRLAQAIDLHVPLAAADEQGRRRRLFLFWILYGVDKSVCLAFGRPPVLSADFYEHVPFPNVAELHEFSPHTRRHGKTSHHAEATSSFGAAFFSQTIAGSKLTGRISEFLHASRAQGPQLPAYIEKRSALAAELSNWYAATYKVGQYYFCLQQTLR